MGDIAAFLGDTDEPLDARIRRLQLRQQGIRGLGGPYRGRLARFLLFLLERELLGLARHAALLKRMPGDRASKINPPTLCGENQAAEA
jgi:hypothetical protein